MCDNPDVIRALLAAEGTQPLAGWVFILLLLTANPNTKDASNRTPLEYAVEKQLNYCALLLSKAQGGEVG